MAHPGATHACKSVMKLAGPLLLLFSHSRDSPVCSLSPRMAGRNG